MNERLNTLIETIEVFSRDELICLLHADYANKEITAENLVEPEGIYLYLLPFGKNKNPTWGDYKHFLSTRTFPSGRADAKVILKGLGIDRYDADAIVRKTHGVMNDDFVWLRYPGENITFKDVRIR